MRVFNRYLMQDFLVIFALTLGVFTFIMCLGTLIKAIDLLAKGIPGQVITSFFVYNMPYVLSFTIPMSTLTATLLLFGRLSIDGEITALRASGMSIWQIISPVILLAVMLSMVCIYLNYQLSPEGRFARRVALLEVGELNPLDLLEEQKYNTDFPGLQIFIGRIDGQEIFDVHINEVEGSLILRKISANRGVVKQNKELKVLNILLKEVRIDQPDPDDPSRNVHFPADAWQQDLNLSQMLGSGADNVRKGRKDMTFREINYAIKNAAEMYGHYTPERFVEQKTKLVIEANKRMTLALSCFSFALLAVPLGMQSRRKESSVGIGISILLVFIFYFFIIVAEALAGYPQLYPELIVWVPVILAQGLGYFMLRRIA